VRSLGNPTFGGDRLEEGEGSEERKRRRIIKKIVFFCEMFES